jgi:hypothetical protein
MYPWTPHTRSPSQGPHHPKPNPRAWLEEKHPKGKRNLHTPHPTNRLPDLTPPSPKTNQSLPATSEIESNHSTWNHHPCQQLEWRRNTLVNNWSGGETNTQREVNPFHPNFPYNQSQRQSNRHCRRRMKNFTAGLGLKNLRRSKPLGGGDFWTSAFTVAVNLPKSSGTTMTEGRTSGTMNTNIGSESKLSSIFVNWLSLVLQL